MSIAHIKDTRSTMRYALWLHSADCMFRTQSALIQDVRKALAEKGFDLHRHIQQKPSAHVPNATLFSQPCQVTFCE